MVIKLAFINFKGGVAKTTTSVNFTANLAKRGYKTLIVDLDPQSNASLWLLGPDRFLARLDDPQKTVYQLFLDRCTSTQTHHFRFNSSVVKAISKDHHGNVITPLLDLLPNTYQAIDLEEKLRVGQANMDILKLQLEDIQEGYDFIIFDCAPNLYLVTINALIFSNYIIIPVSPDYFSRAGLTILCREVKRNWDKYGRFSDDDLELLGVIITRIKENATLDLGRKVDLQKGLNDLIQEGVISSNAVVFETYFNDSVEIPRSIESFMPTIYYKTSDKRIKEYIRRMDKFVDDVLPILQKRYPDLDLKEDC